jgi:hypothetical protein
MFDWFIGFIHIGLALFISSYFIWRSLKLDFYYIICFCILNISWVIFNNECAISYLHKLFHDDKYKLGDNARISDYDLLLGEKNSYIFVNVLLFMYFANLCVILYHSKSKIHICAVILSYIIYITSLRSNVDSYKKDIIKYTHLGLNSIILASFLVR